MLSEKQLAFRAGKISASQAATALGLNRYQTQRDYAYRLRAEIRGDSPPFQQSEPMDWGNRLEEAIYQKWQESRTEKYSRATDTIQVRNHPWLVATPDYLCSAHGYTLGLEVKTAGVFKRLEWGEPGTDQVPEAYRIQAYIYMYAYDSDFWDFAVLIGGQEYREYRVQKPSNDLMHGIISSLQVWYERYVLGGEDPPGESADDEYRESDGSAIEADPELLAGVQQYCELTQKLRYYENLRDELTEEMKLRMRLAEVVRYKGTDLVHWKTSTRKVLDKDRLKYENPELYKKYTKETVARYYRVVAAKRDENV